MKIKMCRVPFIIWDIKLPEEEPSLEYLIEDLKKLNQEFYRNLPKEVLDYCGRIDPDSVYTDGLISTYYDARISSFIEGVELVLVTSSEWGLFGEWYIDLAFRIKGLDSIYHITEITNAVNILKCNGMEGID